MKQKYYALFYKNQNGDYESRILTKERISPIKGIVPEHLIEHLREWKLISDQDNLTDFCFLFSEDEDPQHPDFENEVIGYPCQTSGIAAWELFELEEDNTFQTLFDRLSSSISKDIKEKKILQ